MIRVLVIIENRILSDDNNNIIFSYNGKIDVDFESWLSDQHSINVLYKEYFNEWNICIVTGAISHNNTHPKLISYSSAIKIMDKQESGISDYLRKKESQSQIKLQYGIRNGNVVCISELSSNERGLACNCTCPSCGMPLQARIGKKKQRHFSHNNRNCDTKSANQTALHMLAKEIIEDNKEILLPGIYIRKNQTTISQLLYQYSNIPNELEFKAPVRKKCSSVRLEKRFQISFLILLLIFKEKPA